jgi:uncharacterized membrane protein
MMMDLGYWHPVVVHFVIAWLVAGVILRGLSFLARAPVASQAASLFLVVGALLALLAWWTGEAASAAVLRIPWAADAVVSHQFWGEWTVRLFFVVGLLEAVAFFLRGRRQEDSVLLASAGLGALGLVLLVTTANKGETVVYSYAGGVGLRSSDAADRDHVFLTGAFHVLDADRKDGRPGDAARLLEEMARRYPSDLDVQLLVAESRLVDLKDAGAALEVLGRISIPKEQRRLRLRHGCLMVDALFKKGQREAAMAALQTLRTEFPDEPEVQRRMQAAGM